MGRHRIRQWHQNNKRATERMEPFPLKAFVREMAAYPGDSDKAKLVRLVAKSWLQNKTR